MTRVYDDTIVVDYNQAYVMAGGDWPKPEDVFAEQSNGLCGAAIKGTLWLMTASMDGPIRFIVDVLDREPPLANDYGDIVEVSFEPLQTLAVMTGLMGGPGGCEFALPEQTYRVRYSGKNLEEALKAEGEGNGDEDSRPDQYLLQFWPAPRDNDRILRQSSEWARYRHEIVDGTAARREAEATAAPNPLRDADARTRHAALVWLVQQAGIRMGIAQDPVFVGAVNDSWSVLDEFIASAHEPGDWFAFVEDPSSAFNQASERLRPAQWRAQEEIEHIPRKTLESNPVWHRFQAWAAVRVLLWSPMGRWDNPNDGAEGVVWHARLALQEHWPDVELGFLQRLGPPSAP
jgi:hypothetical protein